MSEAQLQVMAGERGTDPPRAFCVWHPRHEATARLLADVMREGTEIRCRECGRMAKVAAVKPGPRVVFQHVEVNRKDAKDAKGS